MHLYQFHSHASPTPTHMDLTHTHCTNTWHAHTHTHTPHTHLACTHTHTKKNIAPTHTISRILILNPDFIAYTHQIWVSFQWHIAALIITLNLQTKAPKKCHNQPCFIQISCCFSTHTKWHNNSLEIFLNGILTKQYLKNSNKFLWLNSWAVAKLFQK